MYVFVTTSGEVYNKCVITNTRILKQNKHFHTNIYSHIFHTPNVFLSRILFNIIIKKVIWYCLNKTIYLKLFNKDKMIIVFVSSNRTIKI